MEYIEHYKAEKERVLRSMALMDEVEKRSMGIVLEMLDFEILEAEKELDLFLTNQKVGNIVK